MGAISRQLTGLVQSARRSDRPVDSPPQLPLTNGECKHEEQGGEDTDRGYPPSLEREEHEDDGAANVADEPAPPREVGWSTQGVVLSEHAGRNRRIGDSLSALDLALR